MLLSHHPNITMDIINDNLDKPWDWEGSVSGVKFKYEIH